MNDTHPLTGLPRVQRSVDVSSLVQRIEKLEQCLGFISQGRGIFSGAGAPTFASAKGSAYVRTDGGVGTTWYFCAGGTTWNALAGV